MANSNIDFLRFSAYSMKDLITRKLSEDSRFTDQIYEGSNLAILIDIVSYMYQCLAYQLNSAAAESMFADTQLYDNMARLVKFIGYNPRGCRPASFSAGLSASSVSDEWMRNHDLPRFTYFETQKSGVNGPVCFSVKETYPFESDSGVDGIDVKFYNGKWKAYPVVYTASGVENEAFTLEGLQSDSSSRKYVPSDFIHVAVASRYGADGELEDVYQCRDTWIADPDGIFTRSGKESADASQNTATNLYGPRDCVYTVSLDENKTYEIKFGNGVTGSKLRTGDRVYVFYMESDGPLGEIDLTEVDFDKVGLRHDGYGVMGSVVPESVLSSVVGMSSAALRDMFSGADAFGGGEIKVRPKSSTTSSFKPEESVSDMRENAPSWFKTGNRLITARDTEYYIKAHVDGVVDVKCMNNMQYVASLYRWLYENGIKSRNVPERASEREHGVDPGRYYLDNVTFNRASFKYVDPADANNTYLWIKTASAASDREMASDSSQRSINESLFHVKTITTEYQVVRPVLVKFAICANPDLDDVKARYFKETDLYFDQDCESRVEITLDDNMIYVSSNIQMLVYNEIVKAFSVNSQRLGGIVKFSDIADRIYAINGVQRVRTVYVRDGEYRHVCDGLSFASWSDESVLRFHEDLQVDNVMRHVEEFQFPVLEEGTLLNKIKVITKAMHQVHAIKF